MSASKSLLERVDSLMHRKRKFVAGAPSAAENVAASDDEDLPILTEVVDISEVSSDSPNHAVHASPDPRLDAFDREFSQQLQQRFAAELPRLIEESSARLAMEVRQSLQRIAGEVLREIVAGRPAPAESASTDEARPTR